MKYAVVARPPVFGGKVVSFDDSEALKVPGVEKIVEIDGTPAPAKFQPLGGIAVIAKQHLGGDARAATRLRSTWDDGPHGSPMTRRPTAPQLEETARKPAKVVRNEGDVDAALRQAAKKSKPNTTSRIWPTPRWSRRPPLSGSRTANARSGRRVQAPQARATDVAERSA